MCVCVCVGGGGGGEGGGGYQIIMNAIDFFFYHWSRLLNDLAH